MRWAVRHRSRHNLCVTTTGSCRVTQQTLPIFLSESIHTHTRLTFLSRQHEILSPIQYGPIAIRAWMHAAIVEQEVETCLEHFTDEPHLALREGEGHPTLTKDSTGLGSFHFTSHLCHNGEELNGGRVKGDLTRHCRRSGS